MMVGKPVIEFYMVRHGEALHNLRPEIISGQSRHVALSPLGETQSAELGGHLRRIDMRPDLVLASPARRCEQTAAFALRAMGCDMVPVFDDRLLELSQGAWEGRQRDQIYTPAMIKRICQKQMDFSAPDGQSINDVAEQQRELFDELPERFADDDTPKVILGFGHGLATRIRAGKILGWTMDDMRCEITPNTSLTLFTYDGEDWGVDYIGKMPAELESSTIIGA